MGVSDEEDNRNSVSGDDDGDVQRRDDEVVNLETSTTGVSAKTILLLPERNEDNTDWLSHEGIKPTSVFNKMRPEDIATVHTRKEMLDQEVVSPV